MKDSTLVLIMTICSLVCTWSVVFMVITDMIAMEWLFAAILSHAFPLLAWLGIEIDAEKRWSRL